MKYPIHPYVLQNGRVVDEPRTAEAVDLRATVALMPKKPKLALVEIDRVATCGYIQAAPYDRTRLVECREPATHYCWQFHGGMFLCAEHAAWVKDCTLTPAVSRDTVAT